VHYLIVRSPDALTETVTRFSDNHYQASGVSVMDITYLSPEIPMINDNHAFIFTSVYSIQSLSRFFMPTHHVAFCIGDMTAYYARNAGFSCVFVPTMNNSRGLSDLILEKHDNNMLIYCAGVHRKPYLEKNLTDYHLNFQMLELYDTLAIDDLPKNIIDILRHNQDIGLICFSMRNANLLYKLMMKAHIDDTKMCQHKWHIVGQQNEVHLPFKEYHLYDTPQKLYDDFMV
jgi:uroporphyrinogen-III synthase